MAINLKENERIDDLQRSGYQIIQNTTHFCFGMDAVLLSGFAKVKPSDRVLDLGTGTGIIPLLVEGKYKPCHISALEIQQESADMARRSIALNGLEHKIHVVTGDIKEAERIFRPASFDVITCNPPYMIAEHGLQNPDEHKLIARHEVLCTLDDILQQSTKLLPHGGNFYMVHRPFRLAEILHKMHLYGIEAKRIRFVHPYVEKEPNMVLIAGKKGAKSRVTVEKPLIVYEDENVYTNEIYEVYGY